MNKKFVFLVFGILILGFVSSADFNSETVTGYVEGVGGEITKDIEFSEGNLVKGEIQFGDEEANVGKFVNSNMNDKEIIASNVEFSKDKTGSTFSFNKQNGSVEINGDKFENVKKDKEVGHPSFIKLDDEGKIEKADFETNDKGGVYVIDGTEFEVPPNSRVFYDKKNGIIINAKEGGKIVEPKAKEGYEGELQVVKINGKDVNLGNKLILESGMVKWENGELLTTEWDGNVNLNGISILGSNLLIDTSKRACDNCISFDFEDKILIINTNKDSIISFSKDNPFIDFEEGDLFDINTYKGTSLEIQNRDKENKYPLIEIKGTCELRNGDKIYEFLPDGKLFVNQGIHYYTGKDSSKFYTPSPVELYFSNLKVSDNANKHITIDNSGSVFLSSYDKSPVNYNKVTERYVENFVGKEFSFEEGVFEGSKNYILESATKYWKAISNSLSLEEQEFMNKDIKNYKDTSVRFVTDDTFENYTGYKNWFKSDELEFVDYAADRILLNPKEVIIRADSIVRNDDLAYYLAVYGYISEEEYYKLGQKKFDYEYVDKIQNSLNKKESNKIEGLDGLSVE